MLFQINKNINVKFLDNFIKNSNYFFVFNIKNKKEYNYIYNYFQGNIISMTKIGKVFEENLFLNLFSGNFFFCFVILSDFFKVLIDLFFFKITEYNLDLIGLCYNNFFLNFNLGYFNLNNCLFLNFSIILFLIFLFINLFFFKIVLLLNSLVIKKC